ncbi:hypothetical protein B0T20DRAFT_496723 [Sordaria brevicollis]|uniref:Uncharacterized protein n=1 Tax=Sordaria brevicollis TaxID=83679 RepID=A0AAE0UDP3_SORBR|nr:hypothetical protein B0T20DRAFT_496723 [Sordaria brevicollis]
MAGFLIPPWYKPYEPTESDLILATFVWGFTFALSICVLAKGIKQTHRCFRRCHFWNPYIIMVWVEWASCLGVAASSWLFLRVHPLTYMAKLYIEMNIAEFLGKILKQSNRRHSSFSLSNNFRTPATCNSWHPDLEANDSPRDYIFNREWRDSLQQHDKPSGGQMHPLNMDVLSHRDWDHDTEKWGEIHGAGSYDVCTEGEDEVGEPSTPSEVHIKDAPWPAVEVKRRSSSVTSSEEKRPKRQVRPTIQREATCAAYDNNERDGNHGENRGCGHYPGRVPGQDRRNPRQKRDSGVETDFETDELMQGTSPKTKNFSEREDGG